MSLAGPYRARADHLLELTKSTRSLREGSRYRRLAAGYMALAETDDWLAGKTNEAPCGVTP
jgi:hypothetical protein